MTTVTAVRPIDPDALSLDEVRAGALDGRAVTVLGFARSGIALARFLADAGARVTVYDGRPAEALADARARLEGRDVRLLAGPDVDPAAALAGAELVTTSPSINPDYPTTEPRLRAVLRAMVTARAAGDPTAPALVSEPDLFLRLCPAPTIGVTGTKGKTTTSSLIAAILAADESHPAILGGNIGVPLLDRLMELTPRHRVVYELSELQLPTLSRGTTVAVYTNVTSDHLDRHGSLEAYQRVKRRLAELVDPAGALILNADDPVVAGYGDGAQARVIRYSLGDPPIGGVGLAGGWIASDVVGRVLPVEELLVPGRHNVSNALAAVAVGLWFGLEPEAIRQAAGAFTGVEHRLEEVAVVDGVRFVNDSQGTQPDAVIAALEAFDRPLVLIAGGRSKGVDLTELASVVAQRADAAILIGESGHHMATLFEAAGQPNVELAASLDAAVDRADERVRKALASEPEARIGTVLLSPAAASFDMFEDYAARGRAFKAAVAALASGRGQGRVS
jgi:UDP-N-acetylmuramoylalanine--D-glutamate ligase